MNGAEHLAWAKSRAIAFLEPAPSAGHPDMRHVPIYTRYPDGSSSMDDPGPKAVPDINQAYLSFVSDMNKHDDTRHHVGLELGHRLWAAGHLRSVSKMRHWIEGFS